eukprot:CAMPEP_0172724892 /NCGR_PEP_ID=MMETSP1074-20121228/87108_1 /TAXON_ID=2916 /ORGANISM="Ceratium fusus, Strain PA161109" /LENGTH=68 /DNA_ID=CAMNT_0013551515 /DNA_START=535 /DNA_END=738 /DNA_ORIENTATION=+
MAKKLPKLSTSGSNAHVANNTCGALCATWQPRPHYAAWPAPILNAYLHVTVCRLDFFIFPRTASSHLM